MQAHGQRGLVHSPKLDEDGELQERLLRAGMMQCLLRDHPRHLDERQTSGPREIKNVMVARNHQKYDDSNDLHLRCLVLLRAADYQAAPYFQELRNFLWCAKETLEERYTEELLRNCARPSR